MMVVIYLQILLVILLVREIGRDGEICSGLGRSRIAIFGIWKGAGHRFYLCHVRFVIIVGVACYQL
jgi:hypothetical protein